MDRSPCPLDSALSGEIAALLAPPPPQSVQEYYEKLIERINCPGIRVKQTYESGKGVYSNVGFREGELILKDQILVAAQHSSNKVDCLVCSHCFRYIGSVELQIGRKLYLQGLALSADKDGDCETSSHESDEDCYNQLVDENGSVMTNGNLESGSGSTSLKDTIPKEVLESLINGDLTLPYTQQFALPPVLPCPGGCEEEHYCSKLCADSDWELCHSLLCTGGRSESSRRSALLKFIEHANRTNDIFILAAKIIVFTILRYKKLQNAQFEGNTQSINLEGTNETSSWLLNAWKPISMGFKRRWWDCIALPEDVDLCNEEAFRVQIRDLAFSSLELLKEAIFDKEFAPLFSLEIYGHIIGMFELNNLDLVVASPVEDYFIYIDDLPLPEKEEAEKLTRPFLAALGDEYSACCEGTAFFPLQSCMNHSCQPNAKAFKRDEDRDGQAIIIALRPISIGEEITISYIDEELLYEERQAQLADYGFRCQCQKCLKEQS